MPNWFTLHIPTQLTARPPLKTGPSTPHTPWHRPTPGAPAGPRYRKRNGPCDTRQLPGFLRPWPRARGPARQQSWGSTASGMDTSIGCPWGVGAEVGVGQGGGGCCVVGQRARSLIVTQQSQRRLACVKHRVAEPAGPRHAHWHGRLMVMNWAAARAGANSRSYVSGKVLCVKGRQARS